jgi:hypothetical protein
MAVTRHWLMLLALGCSGKDATPPGLPDLQEQSEEGDQELDEETEQGGPNHVAQLFRVSLDLRGVRPTLEEMEMVEADPEAYAVLVDAYLLDDRFAERLRSMYSEVFLTRQDSYTVDAADYGLEDEFLFAQIGRAHV